MTRFVGLRCDVLAKDDVYYIVLYDIDDGNEDVSIIAKDIEEIMHLYDISYILYKTKHGYHVVGFTPLTHQRWSSVFSALKTRFHSYYGGIIIRLSRKQNEVQELVKLEESYGEVIPNLFNLYATRFNLEKKPWRKELSKYLLVFEKYRSKKE